MNPQLIKLLLLVSHKSYREKLEYYEPVGTHADIGSKLGFYLLESKGSFKVYFCAFIINGN